MDKKKAEVEFIYDPLPKQRSFHESDSKFRCYAGGFGSGKTICGAYEAIFQSIWYPQNLGLIGRMTFPELRDTTRKEVLEIPIKINGKEMRLIDSPLIKSFNKTENTLEFKNGSVILFRSLDDAFHKIKSLNLGWFWIDEGAEVDEEIWLGLIGRLRRGRGRLNGFITTNPEGHDWVWKHFISNNDPNYFIVQAPSTENKYLPKGYIQNLIDQYPEEWIKRYVHGSFDTFEGLVYKDYHDKHPFVKPLSNIDNSWYRFVGIDYGYRNPTCALWIAVDPRGNAYVYDEFYASGKLVSETAEIIKTKSDKQNIKMYLIDPSAGNRDGKTGRSVIDEFADNGLFVIPANNEVRAGINRVNEYFKLVNGNPKLIISNNCTNLRRELQTYKWKNIKPNMTDGIERPEKKDDHSVDALRYCVNHLYSTPKLQPRKESVWDYFPSKNYSTELDWRAA